MRKLPLRRIKPRLTLAQAAWFAELDRVVRAADVRGAALHGAPAHVSGVVDRGPLVEAGLLRAEGGLTLRAIRVFWPDRA